MDHLLFLPHRIPYPPNKGDKIRSWHLLKHMAQHYHVHLATFIDDPEDWQYVEHVKSVCGQTHFEKLDPLRAKVKSLSGLATGRPLTLDYYRSAGMQRWVNELLKQFPVERFLVFSSAMAQFVPAQARGTRVIDFVDIDSDKWQQYAERKAWPASMIYGREAKKLLAYERRVAAEFDASLFVSDAESALFRKLAPESAHKVGYFSNGVDTDYFSPAHTLENPYPAGSTPLVFTGAMDYWPNVDAVQWFAQEILPAIRSAHPSVTFTIVGSKPTAEVQALAKLPGVAVTGRVPDVRPYLAHAAAAVAPMRIARGIQNKVLEAMAMAKPVFVTAQALEGIHAVPGRDLLLADEAPALVNAVNAFLARPDQRVGPAARRIAVEGYGWAANLARVDQCLDAKQANAMDSSAGTGNAARSTVHPPAAMIESGAA